MKIVKVPSSDGNLDKNLGCEKAPDEIVKNLEGVKVSEVKVIKGNLDETGKNLEKAKGDIFIGGDHSITYYSFKGFAKEKKNPGLLILDAHLDSDYYTKTVTHEDFVRKLVDEGILKKENVIWVGVRKVFSVEKEFTKGMPVFKADYTKNNLRKVCRKVLEICKGFSDTYLSIDIDVLDPRYAPGTGYQEPNGLDMGELKFFLKKVLFLHNLGRIDLVEVNPDKDEDGKTIKSAVSIINFVR